LSLGPSHVYRFEQIRAARKAMETNSTSGKLIVVIAPDDGGLDDRGRAGSGEA
jgi:hypothetical protein